MQCQVEQQMELIGKQTKALHAGQHTHHDSITHAWECLLWNFLELVKVLVVLHQMCSRSDLPVLDVSGETTVSGASSQCH